MRSSVPTHNDDSEDSLMRSKTRDLLARGWQSEANLSLFLFLLVLVGFILPSLDVEKHDLSLYADIAFTVMLVVGAAIAWADRRLFAATVLFCVVAIVMRWAAWWAPTKTLRLWSLSTGLAAILTITAVLLWQVFRSGPVTVMRVQGAIAAYLCLGFGWAHAYHIAALLNPGAFSSVGSDLSAATSWVDYSFGMLTTVGYAGIVPVHPLAHSLGAAEAVTGQLYLAVLVARLVSMQVSATEGRGR
jgi:hypothetical protein